MEDFHSPCETGMLEVGAQGFDCPPVTVDKTHERRSPAEGLDADAARPGEQVQQGCLPDVWADDIKERFLYPVGDGARDVSGNGAQFPPAGSTGNDS